MKSTILRAVFGGTVVLVVALLGACDRAKSVDVSTPNPRLDAAQNPIQVAIAIPLHNLKQERELMYSALKPHFHVLISNISDQPQNIWREWCSLGYYALSFEVTDASGKTRTITKKKPHVWTMNYPDFWTIPPHESLVLDVNFTDSETWEPFPPAKTSFTMRAVFEIQPDEDAKKSSVWTGRVFSKVSTYTPYGRD